MRILCASECVRVPKQWNTQVAEADLSQRKGFSSQSVLFRCFPSPGISSPPVADPGSSLPLVNQVFLCTVNSALIYTFLHTDVKMQSTEITLKVAPTSITSCTCWHCFDEDTGLCIVLRFLSFSLVSRNLRFSNFMVLLCSLWTCVLELSFQWIKNIMN